MAKPVFRAGKTTQKTTGTEVTAAIPLGTVSGDLLICMFEAYCKAGALPVLTAPAGWTQIGGVMENNSASFKGTSILCWKIYEGEGNAGTWKVSATPENSMNAHVIAYEKGTFSKTAPISAHSEWVSSAAGTTSKAPSVTGSISESVALIACFCPTSPKEPETGWGEVGGTSIAVGIMWVRTAAVTSGESTGEMTYKKATSGASSNNITFLISPPGSFHTQEATNKQSVTPVQRLVERVAKLLTQSQTTRLIRTPARIMAATAKQVISLQLGQAKQGEMFQQQVATVEHSVIRNTETVTQEQNSIVERKTTNTLTTVAKQVMTTIASKTIFLPTITQEQNSASGFRNERIMRASNQQITTRAGSSFRRTLLATQTQLMTTHRSLVKTVQVALQKQFVQAGLTKFVFAQVKQKQVVTMSFKNFRKIGEIFAKVFGDRTESKVYGEVED